MNFRVIFVLYDPKNIKIVYSVNRHIQSSKICCLVLLLNTFGVTVNCVTVIQFSSQYILLLLNSFGVTVICVTLIQFSSQ